jgi:hypothetical protein
MEKGQKITLFLTTNGVIYVFNLVFFEVDFCKASTTV